VGDLGAWVGTEWVWDLRWRRPQFVWETKLLSELLVVITRHSRFDSEDGWSWTLSPDGQYSMRSTYAHLLKGLSVLGAPEGVVLQAASRVWKSCVPSKVVVFSWQLILDRIPTRRNLLIPVYRDFSW